MGVASGEHGGSGSNTVEVGGVPRPTRQSISKGQDVIGADVSTYERAGTGGAATPTQQPLALLSALWTGSVFPVPATPEAVPLTDGRKLRLESLEAGTCRPQGDCGCRGHTGPHRDTVGQAMEPLQVCFRKSHWLRANGLTRTWIKKGMRDRRLQLRKALSLCGDTPRPPIRAMRATRNLKATT